MLVHSFRVCGGRRLYQNAERLRARANKARVIKRATCDLRVACSPKTVISTRLLPKRRQSALALLWSKDPTSFHSPLSDSRRKTPNGFTSRECVPLGYLVPL